MATSRSWRAAPALNGPHRARLDDIPALNVVFSDAFSDRYRRDGMVGVRVPFLNPAIWRYAIDDADDGAMLWRDERGQIAAFNMVHRSGAEGWMGPLAVRAELQGSGTGREVVTAGVEWLRAKGCTVIGLETMPRTMDNIGFYSVLGFVPGRLTLTLTLDAEAGDRAPELLGRLPARDRDDALGECRALVGRLAPGYDYTREITLTDDLSLGDTVLLRRGGEVVGIALCHTAPLVEGRSREELRVLKLVLGHPADFDPMIVALRDYARRAGCRRVAVRMQGEYVEAYRRMISLGARVRWTDLRMAWAGHDEARPGLGMVLSNWEI